MASDRATLANIRDELAEIDAVIKRRLERDGEYATARDTFLVTQMRVWRCWGLVTQLLTDPIPPVRDAVDEANAEMGETWD